MSSTSSGHENGRSEYIEHKMCTTYKFIPLFSYYVLIMLFYTQRNAVELAVIPNNHLP